MANYFTYENDTKNLNVPTVGKGNKTVLHSWLNGTSLQAK